MTSPSVDAAPLAVEGLSFSYPARHVFTHWSHAFAGGLTWLRGGNGSGKSTLLRLVGGALTPRAGRRVAAGIDADRAPLAYRREVCWCGPGGVAFDHLTPLEYFGFMAGLYPRFDANELASHIDGFGLAPFLESRCRSLSTGTQRKVCIAAALVAGTSAVLLDEPTNALDATALAHLHASLARAAGDRRCAWVVASHEPLDATVGHCRIVDLDRPMPGAAD
jgi:ABC-type multidrug transport system ATPase subunit